VILLLSYAKKRRREPWFISLVSSQAICTKRSAIGRLGVESGRLSVMVARLIQIPVNFLALKILGTLETIQGILGTNPNRN
jgi:hypothetical protein